MSADIILQEWKKQQPLYEKLYENGVESYVATLTDIVPAFLPSDRIIRCIDERVEGGIHAGGSLILMTDEEALHFTQLAQPKGITSHAGCGAAKMAYAQKFPGQPLDPELIEEFAIAEAERLALLTGVPYAGHVEVSQMHGLSHLHTARCIYYVGTEEFNPYAMLGALPVGFITSRRYMELDYAVKEVEVGIGIALDLDHAFGRFISEENPLLVIVVGEPTGSFGLAALQEELKGLPDKYEGKVWIEGFKYPKN